jgi:hypothetical protein
MGEALAWYPEGMHSVTRWLDTRGTAVAFHRI